MQVSQFSVRNPVIHGIGVFFQIAAGCLCQVLLHQLIDDIGGDPLNDMILFFRRLRLIVRGEKILQKLRLLGKQRQRPESPEGPLVIGLITAV